MDVLNSIAQFISEMHDFARGLVKDIQNVGVKRNQYIDAENMRLTDPTSDTLGAMTVTSGNVDVFNATTINFTLDSQDYTGLRIAFDVTAINIPHSFVVGGISITPILSALATPVLRYNDLVSKFIAILATNALTATKYIDDPDPTTAGVKYVGFKIFGFNATVNAEFINSVDYVVHILKEFYGVANSGIFRVLKTVNIGDNLFELCTNEHVTLIQVSKKNEVTENWTAVSVFQTKAFAYNYDMVGRMDFEVEIDFNSRVSLYYTGAGYLPRVTYFKLQDAWSAQNAFIWNENPAYIVTGNPDGYYTYENVSDDTKLQVSKNYAHLADYDDNPAYYPTVQTGGTLLTGSKSYTVRQLISDTTSTGWGLVSNEIPIFSDSLTNPNLSGNTGGQPTDKSITMTILGLDIETYDKFQVAVIENTDGVITGKIIGTYTSLSNAQVITHRGNEITTDLTIAELVSQQIVIETAGNLVINRNRLFLSNLTIALDPDLAVVVKAGTTFTTKRITLPAIGNDSARVAEYQDPINVYLTTGYMLNETYRMGTVFLIGGFVTSPYVNGDWTCTYATGELTDNPGGTPDNIYVYYPYIEMDFTGFPAINGVPFEDAIDGFMHVRLPCVPEVLATGYVMPQTVLNTGYYSVGRSAFRLDEYTVPAVNAQRTRLGFLSPDVLFDKATLNYLSSDQLLIYGQPLTYNLVTSNVGRNVYSLIEWDGNFDTAYETKTVTTGELVPFDSQGLIDINGDKYQTTVTVPDSEGSCNQKSSAIALTGEYAVPVTSNTDFALYGVQYFQPQTNKYGNDNEGKYISCGHFRLHSGATTTACNVFGGDTFTQKNITKFCNRNSETANVILSLTTSPPAAIPFNHGVWNYWVETLLPDATTMVSAREIINRSGANDTESVLITWTHINGAVWTVKATDPVAAVNYVIYTGTDNTFIDDNSVSGPPTTVPALHEDFTEYTGFSFYTQNRINTQLRYFPVTDNANYPYTTQSLTQWLGIDVNLPGVLNYSDSYTPMNDFQMLQVYDPELPVQSAISNVMYYSDLKILGSTQDPYRVFLPLNYKAYPAIYGSITNTFRSNNDIVVLMQNAILRQPIDQQAQTVSGGVSIILGDGTVLGAREAIVSNYGSPMKTGAFQYSTNSGRIETVYYNQFHKKVLKIFGDSARDIAEEKFMQSWFVANGRYLGAENSVIFGYDNYTDEILIRVKYDLSAPLWDAFTDYTAGNIVSYRVRRGAAQSSFVLIYFEAQIDVPAGTDPTDVANQLQYWKPYRQSNYLLSYSEKYDEWCSFYGYTCDLFIPYKNTFLTTAVIQETFGVILCWVYEHNRGEHYYNSPADIIGYVKYVVNYEPNRYKSMRNIWARSDNQPFYGFGVGINGSKTYIEQVDFKQKGDRFGWWANIKNDATITADNPTGLNTLHTKKITGETIEMTIFMNYPNKINEVKNSYSLRGRNPQT